MMGLIILTFILLHLAVGLAIGFWLLFTAIKQEKWLKILGSVFGWLIIAISIILMLAASYSATKFSREGFRTPYCPMHEMMMQKHMMKPHMMPMTSENNTNPEMRMMRRKNQMMQRQQCPNCPK